MGPPGKGTKAGGEPAQTVSGWVTLEELYPQAVAALRELKRLDPQNIRRFWTRLLEKKRALADQIK
jgi:hypothetical protein